MFIHNFFNGLTILGNGPDLGYLFAGALVGMFLGVIPGLGGAVVLSIILAFVYHVNLDGTLCLFLGTQAGSYYSASVTSILLNTPAHPEAFTVTFDGFPMAQKGEPGRALGLSAASTCIGGLIGCGVLVGFIQIINQLSGVFHPPEYVALVTLAMLLVGTLGTDSIGKAIAAAGAGFMVSAVGPSTITGVFRYTFGAVGLYDGVSLVALALGLFALPQMIMVYGSGTTVAKQDMNGVAVDATQGVELGKGFGRQIWGGVLESFRHWVVMIQGGLTGALTGLIPGIGGFAANFLSYGIAQQTSKKKHLFGTGIPEGIIAPEGASLAKEAGTMIPIIGLGIPGGVGGALFIAALTIKGIRVGYGFTASYPVIPYEIVWIIALSGIIGTVAGVLSGSFLAKVTKVPGPIMVPFIFALCVVGSFLSDVTFFSVMEVAIFGVIGMALRRLRYPLGSFILALVLGQTFETNIYLTHNIFHGVSFLQQRPLADVLFALSIGVLGLKFAEIRKEKIKSKAELQEALAHAEDDVEKARILRDRDLRNSPYPLLAVLTTVFLLGVSGYFVIYGFTKYNFATAIMPVVGGMLVILPVITFLPRDVYRYIHYLRMRKAAGGKLFDPPPELSMAGSGMNSMMATLSGIAPDGPATPAQDGMLAAMGPPPETEVPVSQRLAGLIVASSWGKMGEYRREVTSIVWFFVLVALCWFFGFVWGVSLFMAAYGLLSTKWFFKTRMGQIWFTVGSTAVMWAFTYEMLPLVHAYFTPKINF